MIMSYKIIQKASKTSWENQFGPLLELREKETERTKLMLLWCKISSRVALVSFKNQRQDDEAEQSKSKRTYWQCLLVRHMELLLHVISFLLNLHVYMYYWPLRSCSVQLPPGPLPGPPQIKKKKKIPSAFILYSTCVKFQCNFWRFSIYNFFLLCHLIIWLKLQLIFLNKIWA